MGSASNRRMAVFLCHDGNTRDADQLAVGLSRERMRSGNSNLEVTSRLLDKTVGTLGERFGF